ncbi:AfsR/SARP family transcriptional regulator (plasmid) [Streptomyces sp. NBC_00335]|uniref:AfsR/SARP family transcriptional regulator n=1 Tax=unclassified Streptomyces TaxID=2593676 RepID=UPI0022553D31|nr:MULTISPECIES: AfsR/SARP family transcriptional regulator [unclassified Streptomyces]MCX5410049.1 AfsR/SARP family transcriptional regulator [Streptomyces sp. NBC_00086]
MEIKVLGSLTAQERGVSVVPTATKPRQLLALLALHAGRVVTVPTLMEEIWGEHIPRSATTTLQTYILQLRRKIGTALERDPALDAKEVLVTRFGGYLLQVPPGQVDAHEFERLAGQGRAAYDIGDYRAASDLLGRSLALWQGPALVDVRAGSILELEVLQLNEERTAALERRIEADIRLGRCAEVIPELRVLAARHPLHEGFCGQLMRALHRSGGGWRALEAYQKLRASLVRELGLEPSAPLQQLHQAVLSGDLARTDPAGSTIPRRLQPIAAAE